MFIVGCVKQCEIGIIGTASTTYSPRIDPLRFMAGCRRRRLNQGLVVALDFLSVLDMACFFVLIFWFLGACFV